LALPINISLGLKGLLIGFNFIQNQTGGSTWKFQTWLFGRNGYFNLFGTAFHYFGQRNYFHFTGFISRQEKLSLIYLVGIIPFTKRFSWKDRGKLTIGFCPNVLSRNHSIDKTMG